MLGTLISLVFKFPYICALVKTIHNIVELAVCPNSDEVFVFRKDRSNKWVVEDILREVNKQR